MKPVFIELTLSRMQEVIFMDVGRIESLQPYKNGTAVNLGYYKDNYIVVLETVNEIKSKIESAIKTSEECSLRDTFANSAMNAFFQNSDDVNKCIRHGGEQWREIVAMDCYAIADAMIFAKNYKRPENKPED